LEGAEPIADTCLLSNFARSGHWELLKRLFPEGMWTTSRVILEVERGVAKYPELRCILDAVPAKWLKVVEELETKEVQEMKRLGTRHAGIRRGADASLLAVAKVRGWILLTDDAGLCEVAKQEGVKFLKSADLLRCAVHWKFLSRSQARQVKEDIAEKARYPRILKEFDP